MGLYYNLGPDFRMRSVCMFMCVEEQSCLFGFMEYLSCPWENVGICSVLTEAWPDKQSTLRGSELAF